MKPESTFVDRSAQSRQFDVVEKKQKYSIDLFMLRNYNLMATPTHHFRPMKSQFKKLKSAQKQSAF